MNTLQLASAGLFGLCGGIFYYLPLFHSLSVPISIWIRTLGIIKAFEANVAMKASMRRSSSSVEEVSMAKQTRGAGCHRCISTWQGRNGVKNRIAIVVVVRCGGNHTPLDMT